MAHVQWHSQHKTLEGAKCLNLGEPQYFFWEAVGHWGPPGYTYAQMGPFPKNSSKMSELFEPLEPETKSLVFPHASQNIFNVKPPAKCKAPL